MKIKNNVQWVGKIDWELRKFHGNEYSTHHGTTYNSYLIKEAKNVLIDTVWMPYAEEFVQKLQKYIELSDIDYIITNHAEIDHSGALPELMKHIPETPIYCTSNGIKSIKGHYHKDWNFIPVKTGDSLDIGNGKKLIFVEMKMLHWPDSMACYLTNDNPAQLTAATEVLKAKVHQNIFGRWNWLFLALNAQDFKGNSILFSNDAFGQHYASEYLFNDLVDQNELFSECLKYYANILTPFSTLVRKKIEEILELKIPIDIIASSHGVIWRENPTEIIKKYIEWSEAYQENQITIIYDTMWDGIRKMAEAISEGIKKADNVVNIKLFNASKTDKNDIITEVFKSKLILVGSPTINRGILTSIAGLLEEIKGLGIKNKKAVAFGTYWWSGESVKNITKLLGESGFEVIDKGIKALWIPNDDTINLCVDFGGRISLI